LGHVGRGRAHADQVDLHDIEFRSSVTCPAGNPLLALDPAHASAYGLDKLEPLGEGDEEVLSAIAELRLLQAEGKIRYVGIAAYPLPILLRFALLILHTTGKPIDVVQTYAHQTLANHALSEGFLEAFAKAEVGLVTNASPLGMGLLTRTGGPEWHPARKTDLFEVTMEAVKMCKDAGVAIEDVATDFGFREIRLREGSGGSGLVPVVVGCKNLEEVHANLRSFALANNKHGGAEAKAAREMGEKVVHLMQERGVRNWSWASP
jgi:D-arabinose 1-dehydrogenase